MGTQFGSKIYCKSLTRKLMPKRYIEYILIKIRVKIKTEF